MRISQSQLAAEAWERSFDVGTARARLAALEGAEGKDAEAERRFLQRRVDKADARARRRAELDGMSADAVAAGIRR